MPSKQIKLDDISEWGQTVFKPVDSDRAVTLRVLEESIEACYSARLNSEAIQACLLMTMAKCRRKQAFQDSEAVAKELGDTIVTAVNALWQRGQDPNQVLGDLLEKLKARAWNRKSDGTYQHIEGNA